MKTASDFDASLVVIVIDFYIPGSSSLKTKRMVVKSLIDRLRKRFNASVVEIAYLDKWQRAAIGISMLSNSRKVLERNYANVEQLMRESGNIELLDMTIEWV